MGALPGGPRRSRCAPLPPGRRGRRAGGGRGARQRPAADRHRPRNGRADDPQVRHRGAEAAVPQAPLGGRGGLVSAVQRAGRRVRPRSASHTCRAGGRQLGDQRAEGLDVQRPRGPLGDPHRPHRPGRAQAPGHHVLRLRHDRPGRRGAAAAAGHRRGRVQRGLPHGRPYPGLPTPRRGRRRLEGRADHAEQRARGHRRHAAAPRGRHDRTGLQDLARAARAAHPRPASASAEALGRGRGRPAHQRTAAPAARRGPTRSRRQPA